MKKIDGILVEYLDLLERKINYKFQRKLYTNWEQLIDDAENNQVHIVLEIQQTQRRDEYLNFYSQLFESNFCIVTKSDAQYGVALRRLFR